MLADFVSDYLRLMIFLLLLDSSVMKGLILITRRLRRLDILYQLAQLGIHLDDRPLLLVGPLIAWISAHLEGSPLVTVLLLLGLSLALLLSRLLLELGTTVVLGCLMLRLLVHSIPELCHDIGSCPFALGAWP